VDRLVFPMVVVINNHMVCILHNKSADFIGRTELFANVKQDLQKKNVYKASLWIVCLFAL